MKKTIMRLMCLCLTASLCLPAACAEGVDSARILAAEQALYALGYHDDDFNAQLDAATQSALRAFQTANGLEPTGELDTLTGLQVVKIFKDLTEQEGVTIVMTTHDTSLMEVGDAVYELEDGEVIDGSV